MNWTLPLYLLSQCLCFFGIVSKVSEEHEKLKCLEMRKHTWYKGNIEPHEAEHLLLAKTLDGKYAQPDGAFLVRDRNFPEDLTLAVKFGDAVQHIRIYLDSYGAFLFWGAHFISVYELVTYYRKSSASRNDLIRIYLKDMIEMDPEPLSEGESKRHQKAKHISVARMLRNWWGSNSEFGIPNIYQQEIVRILSVACKDHPDIYQEMMLTKRYIALYDFEPQECEELLLKKGDEITVIHDNDPYWWKGTKCRTYQVGYFPREYVGKSTK